jgi:hypothetical protein
MLKGGARLILGVGWYSNNLGVADYPCWTCCKAPQEVKEVKGVKKAPTPKKVAEHTSQGICFKVCWPAVPTCPDGN